MLFFKYNADYTAIVDYACSKYNVCYMCRCNPKCFFTFIAKPCQSSNECDSSNNEECFAGSCNLQIALYPLKCVPPYDYGKCVTIWWCYFKKRFLDACPAPLALYSGFCDNSWVVNCFVGLSPYPVTCLDNGICCYDMNRGK